jgi:hypothetical protein
MQRQNSGDKDVVMPIYTINGKNILFIHIPKTGGMAISAELAKVGQLRFDEAIAIGGKCVRPRHADAGVLEAIFDPSMFDLVFTVVRNPISRMVSEFKYQSRKSGVHLAGLFGFDRWLSYSLARCRREPSYRDNHFLPQSNFLAFNATVFPYESGLDKPMQEVSRITGHNFPMFPERKNSSLSIPVDVSSKSRLAINNFFHEDFKQFGYVNGL